MEPMVLLMVSIIQIAGKLGIPMPLALATAGVAQPTFTIPGRLF